jgi:hypothetical protein
MVTVKSVVERMGKDEKPFIALEITGDIELVQSQETGRFYATIRRTFMSSTFDKATAEAFIGKQMPGNVVRMASDPYEFTVPETGEVIELKHSWVYQPEDGPRKVIKAGKAPVGSGSFEELIDEING